MRSAPIIEAYRDSKGGVRKRSSGRCRGQGKSRMFNSVYFISVDEDDEEEPVDNQQPAAFTPAKRQKMNADRSIDDQPIDSDVDLDELDPAAARAATKTRFVPPNIMEE